MANIIKSIKRFILGNNKQVRSDNSESEANPMKEEAPSPQVQRRDLSQAPFREIQTNYLAFDLEIAKSVPGGFNNWRDYRPLGISCAATIRDGEDPLLWFSKNIDGSIAPRLTEKDSIRLGAYLYQAMEEGWKIVTWNGLGFDFQILAEESNYWGACSALALGHIDLMFHLFCIKGYPLALNRAALGMNLPGKLEGVTGEMAPILWQQGQHEKVLRYVAQDARTTLDLAKAGLYYKRIHWTSNSGNDQSIDLPNGWRCVEEVMTLPKPDTSWMHNPMERSSFFQWISDYRLAMKEFQQQSEQEKHVSNATSNPSEPLESNIQPNESELSEDEINWLLAQCDQADESDPFPITQLENNKSDPFPQTQPENRVQSEISYASGCPCPICQGAPNLDFRFQLYEEHDDY